MIQENFNLRPYNTFGIEVFAKRFSAFTSISELEELLSQRNDDELLFLGGGSNVLFTKDFDGLVLRNELKGIEVIDEDDTHVILKSGAGEVWHDFVLHCVENNYGGIENLSLIPIRNKRKKTCNFYLTNIC